MIRAYLVDDEELAIKRLTRLCGETGRVEVIGSSTDPVFALAAISEMQPDLLFLDIQMPGLTGFEMLQCLDPQPLTVFTTAYDQYALKAFEVNSIDYLLKPVEPGHLARAVDKVERLRQGGAPPQMNEVLRRLAGHYPDRVASRFGDRTHLLDLQTVTHFFAEDKLTFAATETKNYVVDRTITELEKRLDPKRFFRIHRATLVNLAWVAELDSWFGGKMLVRLRDGKRTELAVSRDRVQELKKRLDI